MRYNYKILYRKFIALNILIENKKVNISVLNNKCSLENRIRKRKEKLIEENSYAMK